MGILDAADEALKGRLVDDDVAGLDLCNDTRAVEAQWAVAGYDVDAVVSAWWGDARSIALIAATNRVKSCPVKAEAIRRSI